jgi:hypothetical protein
MKMKGVLSKSTFLHVRNLVVAFLLTALVLPACKKDSVAPPSISLEKSVFALPAAGSVTVKVIATSKAGTEDLTIPFTLAGTAVKGTEYEVSAEAFVIKAGTNSGEITFTAKDNYAASKSIQLTLGGLPSGYVPGKDLSATITVANKDEIIYSFEQENNELGFATEITVLLKTAKGTFVAEKEMRIPILVDASSTAVEGTHYSFEGAKEVVIPIGKSKGVVSLKSIKQEAGKDVIKLKVGEVVGFIPGQYETSSIKIITPLELIKGKWQYVAFSNQEWLALNIFDDASKLPSKNTDKDVLEITADALKAAMTGDVKNYFRDCALTFIKEETEVLQEESGFPPKRVKIQVMKMSKTNVAFSASTISERAAEIGFRVFREDGKDILEITLRDYEPEDFMKQTYKTFIEFGDVPVLKTMPIRYHFERVK